MTSTPAVTDDAVLTRLAAATSQLTTAALTAMEERHEWFRELPAEPRSWITVVARAGIDGFVAWQDDHAFAPDNVFSAAPRALLRRVTLAQTVELVRTVIDVVGEELGGIVDAENLPGVERALLEYSREVAFAAAGVYARAAELRGAWDARLESLVVDALVRGDTDEDTLSRASTLGWHATERVCVVAGAAGEPTALDDARLLAAKLSLDVLAGPLGDRMVLVLGGEAIADAAAAMSAGAAVAPLFGPGPVVVGPVVEHLIDADASARAALAGLRAARAWAGAPPVLAADELLPERALAGDEDARAVLVSVRERLAAAGGDLLATCEALFDHLGSVEATARSLFVHANTVRYRLRRIHDVTGYSPTDARDAYVLRLALTLGRLAEQL